MLGVDIAGSRLMIEEERVWTDVTDRIQQYIGGKRVSFREARVDLTDLTDFQRRVLAEIRAIPYGKTISYMDLAHRIGRPDAVRAVAVSCGINPVPIVIPCHRVVGKNGLGGFSAGKNVKRALLQIEGAL